MIVGAPYCAYSDAFLCLSKVSSQTPHTLRPRAYAPARAPRARARAPLVSRFTAYALFWGVRAFLGRTPLETGAYAPLERTPFGAYAFFGAYALGKKGVRPLGKGVRPRGLPGLLGSTLFKKLGEMRTNLRRCLAITEKFMILTWITSV